MKKNNSRNWEEFALIDPMWSIITDKKKKYGQWQRKDFFLSGENEINNFFKRLSDLNININWETVLDHGCGLGRLSRALKNRFNCVEAVDASSEMIKQAKDLNLDQKINFFYLPVSNLSIFENNHFDLIYSSLTLQHIKNKEEIKEVIREFERITKPGGIIFFQLPAAQSFSKVKEIVLKFRSLIYFLLIGLGLSRKFVYQNMKLAPFMHMSHLSSSIVKKAMLNCRLVEIACENSLATNYLFVKF